MNPPLLSIVTPVLNRREFVADAIDSVLDQDVEDVEHIVVDGGSTDGTLDELARFPHLVVVSEPDQGLYDALNKGLGLARGRYVGHLNSDDLYEPHVFSQVVAMFEARPDADVVAGGVDVFEVQPDGARAVLVRFDAAHRLGMRDVTRDVPMINGRFFRREVFTRVGHFDLGYSVAADREFLLRTLASGVMTVSLPMIVYHYRQHEGSLTMNATGSRRARLDHLRISESYSRGRGVPPVIQREARRWYAQELGRMLRHESRAHGVGGTLTAAVAGLKVDPLWPVRYAAQGALRRFQRHREEGDPLPTDAESDRIDER